MLKSTRLVLFAARCFLQGRIVACSRVMVRGRHQPSRALGGGCFRRSNGQPGQRSSEKSLHAMAGEARGKQASGLTCRRKTTWGGYNSRFLATQDVCVGVGPRWRRKDGGLH